MFAHACAVAASFELGDALEVIIPGTLGAALFVFVSFRRVFVFFRRMEEPLSP